MMFSDAEVDAHQVDGMDFPSVYKGYQAFLGELVPVLLPKKADEPGLHIAGRGHGVCDGENILRADALAADHVPQAGDQHGAKT